MKEETQATIKSRHVHVLAGFAGDFECGDGWAEIIDDMLTDLLSPFEECHNESGAKPMLLQLKEKFGELRVYVCPANPAIEDTIYDYVKLSREICERCGKRGSMRARTDGWLATRCDECFAMEQPA